MLSGVMRYEQRDDWIYLIIENDTWTHELVHDWNWNFIWLS